MAEWYCTVGGQKYGPLSQQQLQGWITEGRLARTDLVWRQGMADWQPASQVGEFSMSFAAGPPSPRAGGPAYSPGPPTYSPGGYGGVEPHRGGAVLTLGILGLVVCVICGIIAWVMGSTDLAKMRAGTMDRSGEGNTRAGMICGMISCILNAVGLVIWLIIFATAASAVRGRW